MDRFAERGLFAPVEPTAPVLAPTRRGDYQGGAATGRSSRRPVSGTGPARSSAGVGRQVGPPSKDVDGA